MFEHCRDPAARLIRQQQYENRDILERPFSHFLESAGINALLTTWRLHMVIFTFFSHSLISLLSIPLNPCINLPMI